MKHGAFKWPLIAGFFLCLQAKAAWLQICPADSTAVPGRLQALITRPDKPGLLARVADTPAGATCEQLELPLSASDVVGLHPIAARLTADRAAGLPGCQSQRKRTVSILFLVKLALTCLRLRLSKLRRRSLCSFAPIY